MDLSATFRDVANAATREWADLGDCQCTVVSRSLATDTGFQPCAAFQGPGAGTELKIWKDEARAAFRSSGNLPRSTQDLGCYIQAPCQFKLPELVASDFYGQCRRRRSSIRNLSAAQCTACNPKQLAWKAVRPWLGYHKSPQIITPFSSRTFE